MAAYAAEEKVQGIKAQGKKAQRKPVPRLPLRLFPFVSEEGEDGPATFTSFKSDLTHPPKIN